MFYVSFFFLNEHEYAMHTIECQCGFCFTECSPGVFGKDCVENCSMTCGDPGICDKVTGHCYGSCLPGWEGDMCQNGNDL